MKLTGNEILEKLSQFSFGQVAYGDYDQTPFGEVAEVEDFGGEGQGETRYVVWYFKDHDVYIRIDGYYQSYNGSEWDNAPYQVTPVERTVTFYE